MNEDFLDLLSALIEQGARFMVVGAHAMAVHGVPRATGDLDVWVDPSGDNPGRVLAALTNFGAPVDSLGLSAADFAQSGRVVQIGQPPRRLDLLNALSGLEFEDAWPDRVTHRIGTLDVPFIGRQHLIRNKRATGRAKDLADLEALGESTR